MPPAPTAAPRWRTVLAPHQTPLDAALLARVGDAAPGTAAVIVRTAEQQRRYARLVPIGTEVHTLSGFFGLAGPEDIRDDDILPGAVLRRIVERSLPPEYHKRSRRAARRHLASEITRALKLLDAQGLRLDGRSAEAGAVEALVAVLRAQEAVDAATPGLHALGLWFDGERVSAAARGPARTPHRFPRLHDVMFVGFDVVSPREREAIRQVTAPLAHVTWYLVGRPPGATDHPGLSGNDALVAWAADHGPVEHLGPTGDRVAALAHVFSDGLDAGTALAGVTIVRPADAQAEIDEAARWARRLMAAGTEPAEIALVVPDVGAYGPALRARLAEHGLPFRTTQGVLTRQSPSGGFLWLLLDDLDQAHARDTFLDLVAHPIATWPLPVLQQPDHGVRLALRPDSLRRRLIERGAIPRGRDAWDHAFERLMQPAGPRLGASAGRREPSDAWRRRHDAYRHLLDALEALRTTRDAYTWIDGVRTFFETAGIGAGVARALRDTSDPGLVRRGHERMLALLDEAEDAVALAPGPPPSADDVRDGLRVALAHDTVAGGGDLDHGVQVTSLRNTRGLRFRHVRVLGCTQENLPPRDHDAPLVDLLETATGTRFERIHPDDEARRALHGLIADTAGTVILSAPSRDGDAEVAASVLLEELQETAALDDGLREALAVDRAPVSRRETLRHAGTTRVPLAPTPVALLRAQQAAATHGTGDDASPYGGRLEPAAAASFALVPRPPRTDPTRAPGVSASTLEAYARCPFRYLVEHGFGLREPPSRDDGPTPIDRGRILHHILDTFTRQALAEHKGPVRLADVPDAATRLQKIVTDLFADNDTPDAAWQAFRVSLLSGLPAKGNLFAKRPPGVLARFLAAEEKVPGHVVASEAPFGSGSGPDVTITTPNGVLHLHGTIDRIDLDDAGLHVYDYKSGKRPSSQGTAGGIDLQLPLYLHGARALFPGHAPAGAAYYSLKADGRGSFGPPRTPKYVPAPGGGLEAFLDTTTADRIGSMQEAARAGWFAPTLLSEAHAGCDHCDVRRVCGMRPHLARARLDAALDHTDRYVPDLVRPVPTEEAGP